MHSPASDLSSLPDETNEEKVVATKVVSSSVKKTANGHSRGTNGVTVTKTNAVVEVEADGAGEGEGEGGSKGKVKAKGKVAKRVKTEINGEPAAEEDEAPKKKPRVSKASIFPPPELDPSIHPARKGYPAFQLPDLPPGIVRNGGLPSAAVGQQPMLLGAHTSIAGGPATALLKAGMLGANGLAMFVKSQRQWKSKDYEDEAVERFRTLMKSKAEGGASSSSIGSDPGGWLKIPSGLGYGAESILVHGSYLINLG